MRKNRRKSRGMLKICTGAALLSGVVILTIVLCGKKEESGEDEKEKTETVQLVVSTENEEDEKLDTLEQQLESITNMADGTYSIYIKDLSSDQELSVNNRQMYAASLIKLFVMKSVYEHEDQIVEYDSAYSGSEEKSREKIGDLLQSMITVSDNEAYNELVRMHSAYRSFTDGCSQIETYIQEQNFTGTGIFHTLSPSSTESQCTENRKNYTCAEDCGALLEQIYDGTCVSREASEEMMDLLLEQQVTGKIPAGVPDTVQTANKTGETEDVQHDAAIVFGTQTDYILCVMSEDFTDSEAAVSTIQDISSLVYETLNT